MRLSIPVHCPVVELKFPAPLPLKHAAMVKSGRSPACIWVLGLWVWAASSALLTFQIMPDKSTPHTQFKSKTPLLCHIWVVASPGPNSFRRRL